MIGFPLLLIPLAIYNIFIFLMPGVALNAPAMTLALPSRAGWVVTIADVIVVLALFLLLVEVVKAARPGARSLMDHLLSFVAFALAAAEFLWLPQFATSAFFLLAAMIFVEFTAGAMIGLRRRVPARLAAPVPAAVNAPPAPVSADEPQPETAARPSPEKL
jgi:cation transport ATPase